MIATVVLTFMGPDQPGLVETVSGIATKHGANWEASRMTRLGGRFAGLVLVTMDPSRASALETELERLSERGLRVMVERSAAATPHPTEWRYARLELLATDRPGIIHNVSSLVSRLGVNVVELSSDCTSAPMAGGELFRLSARLACPPSVSEARLTRELECLDNDLMVHVSMEEA